MSENRYDVIVVGARCAGSPTAMLLARAGVGIGCWSWTGQHFPATRSRPTSSTRRAWRRCRGGACSTGSRRPAAHRFTPTRSTSAHSRSPAHRGPTMRRSRTARDARSWTSYSLTRLPRSEPRCGKASPFPTSCSPTAGWPESGGTAAMVQPSERMSCPTLRCSGLNRTGHRWRRTARACWMLQSGGGADGMRRRFPWVTASDASPRTEGVRGGMQERRRTKWPLHRRQARNITPAAAVNRRHRLRQQARQAPTLRVAPA